MNTIAESSHIPTSTLNRSLVSTLNRKPEARSWRPRYGTEKTSATITTRMRMNFASLQ